MINLVRVSPLKTVFFLTIVLAFSCGPEVFRDRTPDRVGFGVSGTGLNPPLNDETRTRKPQIEVGFKLSLDKQLDSQFCGTDSPVGAVASEESFRFDANLIEDKLSSTGLIGWMHASVSEYKQYVFTYRDEEQAGLAAFFRAEQFSLISRQKEIFTTLGELHRHDQIRIYGSLQVRNAGIRHINVTRIELVKSYETPVENRHRFDPKTLEPVALGAEQRLFGKVHAVAGSVETGMGLALENQGYVVPIVLSSSHRELATRLYRNDILNVAVVFIPSKNPNRPPHFVTDSRFPDPFMRVDLMRNCHGKSTTLEGELVKFPKSPVINRDIFAIRVIDSNGIGRNFTFFPAADPSEEEFSDVFEGVNQKAAQIWDSRPSDEIESLRNYYGNPKIRVRASGKMNIVSPAQANPQVYLQNISDVEIEVIK